MVSMTPTELAEVVAAGESFTVEFKRGQRSAMSDNDIVDAAICLANGDGGQLPLATTDLRAGQGAETGAEQGAYCLLGLAFILGARGQEDNGEQHR